MLFSGIIILLFIILGFMYATAKLTVYLNKSPYINIFYVLMLISFITTVEILFCIYLYITFRTKDGEEGPRGFQGFPGNKGDPGICPDNCKKKTIQIMIQKIFEKNLGRKLTANETQKLFDASDSINIVKISSIDENEKNIDDLTLEDVKKLHQFITEKVELGYYKIDNISFDKNIIS